MLNTIMSTQKDLSSFNRPRKVVFYGRVSTEHEEQTYALKNQMQWYDELCKQYPNWSVVDRYVDDGITGTKAKKRPEFMRMMGDATANQSVISITTKQVNSKFLYYYLQFVRNELLALQNGSAQGGLTLKYLKTFLVRYPNEIDQKQIVNVLEACDAQIHLQQEKLNMFNLQRKALQQYLLTGIVRVKTN